LLPFSSASEKPRYEGFILDDVGSDACPDLLQKRKIEGAALVFPGLADSQRRMADNCRVLADNCRNLTGNCRAGKPPLSSGKPPLPNGNIAPPLNKPPLSYGNRSPSSGKRLPGNAGPGLTPGRSHPARARLFSIVFYLLFLFFRDVKENIT